MFLFPLCAYLKSYLISYHDLSDFSNFDQLNFNFCYISLFSTDWNILQVFFYYLISGGISEIILPVSHGILFISSLNSFFAVHCRYFAFSHFTFWSIWRTNLSSSLSYFYFYIDIFK